MMDGSTEENDENVVMDQTEDDDDESSSDSSSSDEDQGDGDDVMDDEELKKLEEEIEKLDSSIAHNPFAYDSHVQLIQCLRKTGKNASRLRAAREKMSSLFPLSESLWLEWLRDESAVQDKVDKDYLTTLFERSVKDYASVPVWLEVFYYSLRGMADPGGTDNVRKAAERAIASVGLNASEGTAIWEAYREFELAILASLQPAPGSVASVEAMKQIEEQMARISALFKRQLSVPLLDMEKTYAEYQSFIEGEVDEMVQKKYANALSLLDDLRPLEEAVAKTAPPNLEAYKPYIDFEKSRGDPTRIQSIFERAIKDNCLQPELWISFTHYLETELRVASVTLSALERAVRNCPWSVALWVSYLQSLEQHKEPHIRIKEVLSQALLAGFTQGSEFLQLWTAYLDYLRRHVDWTTEHSVQLEELRNNFDRAITQLFQHFGMDGDPECSLNQYWAFIEAKYCKNMSKSRELWAQIMQSGFGSKAAMWLEYSRLERSFGDVKHCRKLFQKAVNSVSDWPESVFQAYISFEREEGDLDNYKQAVVRCEAQLKRVEERRAQEAAKEVELTNAKKKGKKSEKSPRKGSQQSTDNQAIVRPYQKISNTKSNESTVNKNPSYRDAAKSEQPSTSKRTEANQNPLVFVRGQQQKRKLENDTPEEPQTKQQKTHPSSTSAQDGFKLPGPPPPGSQARAKGSSGNNVADSPTATKLKAMSEEGELKLETSSHGKTAGSDKRKDERTVFISNLDYDLSERRIKEIFEEISQVAEIRLVTNFKGRSKGFAYVEFVDEFAVLEALKLDRKPIDGRPMFVSKCNTSQASGSSSSNKLKFSVGLERNKLFVSGLSRATTKEELEECFGVQKLKDVRIVTFRNGVSKGLAYVEYENEDSAGEAILKLDGSVLNEHTIAVAISNPPARNAPKDKGFGLQGQYGSSSYVPSLGGGKKDTSDRGKARTKLAMMPRALSRAGPSSSSATTVSGDAEGANGTQGNHNTMLVDDTPQNGSDTTVVSNKPMSNDDFSNMMKH